MTIFSQIYLQIVFTVKGRNNFINNSFKDDLLKYITGTIENKNHKLYAINSMPDHIHIFISLNPVENISDLIRDIKRSSSLFIKEKQWLKEFQWQTGYGVFSYSKSQIQYVINYIDGQEEHHKKKSFREEFEKLLEEFNVIYNQKYLFEFYDDTE